MLYVSETGRAAAPTPALEHHGSARVHPRALAWPQMLATQGDPCRCRSAAHAARAVAAGGGAAGGAAGKAVAATRGRHRAESAEGLLPRCMLRALFRCCILHACVLHADMFSALCLRLPPGFRVACCIAPTPDVARRTPLHVASSTCGRCTFLLTCCVFACRRSHIHFCTGGTSRVAPRTLVRPRDARCAALRCGAGKRRCVAVRRAAMAADRDVPRDDRRLDRRRGVRRGGRMGAAQRGRRRAEASETSASVR